MKNAWKATLVIVIAAVVTVSAYFIVSSIGTSNNLRSSQEPSYLSNSTGQKLQVGEFLVSPNQLFCARLEKDGVFRVYQGIPGQMIGNAVWTSPVSRKAHMKRFLRRFRASQNLQYEMNITINGNLCINDGVSSIWCSATRSNAAGPYFMVLQDNGQVVVFSGLVTTPLSNSQVWSSPAPNI